MITLYKNHGKSIGYWEGSIREGGLVVMRHAKSKDALPVEQTYQAKGKNIGRANETTPMEQAQAELESRAKKKLDKGYVRTLLEALVPPTNSLGLEQPMLATPLNKVKPETIDWDNSFAQPKLDGHRCLFKDGHLYSRGGKPLDIPHIREAIYQAQMHHMHLDGELYVHGRPLNEISRMVKKATEDTLALEYHIYDVVMDAPFQERNQIVNAAFDGDTCIGPLVNVDTFRPTSMEQLDEMHKMFLNMGYEGSMLRTGLDPYLTGKRSAKLLKIKEFHDAEFTVIGVLEGKPYIRPEGVWKVPVWLCSAGNGNTFTVTCHGTMHEKHEFWLNREDYIGRPLTVKYHYLSADGIPQLPVAIGFRLDF